MQKKTWDPVTKRFNDCESSLWFTRILTPWTRDEIGRRRLVRPPYLRLRLSEGDTLPSLSHKLFTVRLLYRSDSKQEKNLPRIV